MADDTKHRIEETADKLDSLVAKLSNDLSGRMHRWDHATKAAAAAKRAQAEHLRVQADILDAEARCIDLQVVYEWARHLGDTEGKAEALDAYREALDACEEAHLREVDAAREVKRTEVAKGRADASKALGVEFVR